MKKIMVMMLTLMMTLSLAACGSDGSKADSGSDSKSESSDGSDMAYVKDKGTLVVGITDFEPMDLRMRAESG